MTIEVFNCPEEAELPPIPEGTREWLEQAYPNIVTDAASLSDAELEERVKSVVIENVLHLLSNDSEVFSRAFSSLSQQDLEALGLSELAQFLPDGSTPFGMLSHSELLGQLSEFNIEELLQVNLNSLTYLKTLADDPANPDLSYDVFDYAFQQEIDLLQGSLQGYLEGKNVDEEIELLQGWHPEEEGRLLGILEYEIANMRDIVMGKSTTPIKNALQNYYRSMVARQNYLIWLQEFYPLTPTGDDLAKLEQLREVLLILLPQQLPLWYELYFGENPGSPEIQELLQFYSLVQEVGDLSDLSKIGAAIELFGIGRDPLKILLLATEGEQWAEYIAHAFHNPSGATFWSIMNNFLAFLGDEGGGIGSLVDFADVLYAIRRWAECKGTGIDVLIATVPVISGAALKGILKALGLTGVQQTALSVDELLEIIGRSGQGVTKGNLIQLITKLSAGDLDNLIRTLGEEKFIELLTNPDLTRFIVEGTGWVAILRRTQPGVTFDEILSQVAQYAPSSTADVFAEEFFSRYVELDTRHLETNPPGTDLTATINELSEIVANDPHAMAIAQEAINGNPIKGAPSIGNSPNNTQMALIMFWGQHRVNPNAVTEITALAGGQEKVAQYLISRGVTLEVAEAWRDFYTSQAFGYVHNPAGPGRAVLMQWAVDILEEAQ